MPTYEFRCPEGHDFEKFYRTISSAESQAACPVCGKLSERRMSATGFSFKGSGFYLTDYGKNAHRGTAPEGKPASGASSESSSGTGGESKPASSSDSSSSAPAKPAESKPAAPPSKPGSSE